MPRRDGWPGYVLLASATLYAALLLTAVWLRTASTDPAAGTSDFRDFWENAVHVRQTGQVATDRGVHNYLPFFTIFMAPWGWLPLRPAAVLFSALSLALFALTAYLAEALLAERVGSRPRPALLVALLLALPYVHSCVVLGNVGLLVLFLVMACWFLVERGREYEAGLALGLAALIKLLPAALLVFFLLKRRWRVAGSAGGVVIVLGLGLPLATLGWRGALAAHREFLDTAVRGHSAARTIMADQPPKAHFSNNALPIVLRRLLTPLDGGTERTGPLRVNIADWSRRRVLLLYYGLLVAIVGLSVVVALRSARPWPPDSPAAALAVRAQFGAWCALMLLAAPLVWTHYLPLVYWPLALLADHAARDPGAARAHRDPNRARKEAAARPGPLPYGRGSDRTGRGSDRTGRSRIALAVWLLGAALLAWPAARAAGAQLATVAWLWGTLLLLALPRERSSALRAATREQAEG